MFTELFKIANDMIYIMLFATVLQLLFMKETSIHFTNIIEPGSRAKQCEIVSKKKQIKEDAVTNATNKYKNIKETCQYVTGTKPANLDVDTINKLRR